MLLLSLCAELVVRYELGRKICRRVADLVYPFCFIVEAHRVGFPFLVVFLQLNRSFGAICGVEGFWTANAVASVG